MTERIAHQPIHPTFISRVDPEYVAFHNSTMQYIERPETLKWNPALRNAPAVPGGSEPLEVAKTQDFDLTHTKIRAYTPMGDSPTGGWPLFIFFHGGGWTFGNIGAEASFSTNMAVGAHCVVISVDYRLAPENPYPAAVEDAIEALEWAVEKGKQELNINVSRIALGGSSSGGNLATILALKNAEKASPVPILFQLLIVPVIDNTASVQDQWEKNQLTPWLTPVRMLWFRKNYLPNEEDWTKWDASPIFAPAKLLATLPKTWIAVAGLDILSEEGIAYGKKLQEHGVDVEIKEYERAPHPIMAMDGVLQVGKKLVFDAATALTGAFGAK